MNTRRKIELQYLSLGGVFTLVLFLFFFLLCRYDRITYDSSYQYALNLHSLTGIFELLPADYSPPLYSILLKGYSAVFGVSLTSLRFLSFILLSSLFFLALFPFRRLAGKYAAVTAAVLFLTTSYNLFFCTEIRPTVLAYVLTTALFVYVALVFFDRRKSDMIVFTVLASLCMYTHNVSLITAFFVYGLAVILSITIKRYDLLKKFLISGLVVSVIYIPWLIVLIRQFENVLERYWSEHHSLGFGFYIAFFGITENNYFKMLSLIPAAVMILLPFINLLLAVDPSRYKTAKHLTELIDRKDLSSKWPNLKKLLFIVVFVSAPIIGFYIFTQTILPVFALRYIYILSGGGIVFTALLATLSASKKTFTKIPAIVLSALMIFTFICNIISDHNTFVSSKQEAMMSDIYSLSGEAPAIMDFSEQCLGVLSYAFPDSPHYVIPQTAGVLRTFDVFVSDIHYLNKADDIWNDTDEFFIINSMNINSNSHYPPEYYLEFFDDNDFVIEKIGCYRVPYCNELGRNFDEYIVYRCYHETDDRI